MVYNWIKNIPNLLYPPRCLLCGTKGDEGLDLCRGCRSELPYNHYCCRRCALPLPQSSAQTPTCAECRKQRPQFDRCLAPLLYQPPVDRLIGGLKFEGRLTSGRLLAALLSQYLHQHPHQTPDLIIPVPLHPARLRQRGYNQALELARPLCKEFSLPLDRLSCRRCKPTLPQICLERRSRKSNLHGAFSVSPSLQADHVVLLDDVVTTGATVSELAATLKRCGIPRVDVWTVARTP